MSVAGAATSAARAWDPAALRQDFPMLNRLVRGRPLVYLDNAATALKPEAVIAAMTGYYREYSANVQRGVHTTSQEATARYEEVRARAARWIGATRVEEIVFTAGTTASLNLVAQSLGGSRLSAGDEILVSEMEHHSNIVPWQLLAERTGAVIRRLPITDRGELDLDRLRSLCSGRARIVAICHVSNVLGSVVPIAEVTQIARAAGVVTVVDGAQGAPHLPVNVGELGCDFYAFSGHKAFGPTGVGVLFGRLELLETMPPWQGGGGMIAEVELERSSFAPPPARFEAGTPPIAEVLGLGAALEYIGRWNRAAVLTHEDALMRTATERLSAIDGVHCYGTSRAKVAVVSFTVKGIHPHDVGTALDAGGVAVRAGHHCAQPLMRRFGVTAMVRASFGPYNSLADVDALVDGVERARAVFGR
jgi:cysteine desulfurase/selenocysteine lyase